METFTSPMFNILFIMNASIIVWRTIPEALKKRTDSIIKIQ